MNSGPTVTAAQRGKCPDLVNLNDTELLARFFQDKVDAVFAAIVERHGPLVYGVCHWILADPNDAEDAFQATFLVLVRKGGRSAIRGGWRIGSTAWLIARRASCGRRRCCGPSRKGRRARCRPNPI